MSSDKRRYSRVCKANGIKPERVGRKRVASWFIAAANGTCLARNHPDNATPEQIAKTEKWFGRKCCAWPRSKYLFRIQDRRLTTGIIVQDGRLSGLKVVETKIEGHKG